MSKKPKSTFEKITRVVVWIMIIAMIGGTVIGTLGALGLL
ncbi:DUF4044 domain-containing protein [Vagococcus sp.]